MTVGIYLLLSRFVLSFCIVPQTVWRQSGCWFRARTKSCALGADRCWGCCCRDCK